MEREHRPRRRTSRAIHEDVTSYVMRRRRAASIDRLRIDQSLRNIQCVENINQILCSMYRIFKRRIRYSFSIT